ncbi:hypothetical protein CEXT_186011 [Caerostris extrusa]|uniref:Uncharacterized protein n=1 Tax=Caerostris extrusa TaxID=172846 RepID=A0AAV4MHH0_CAEEX|nr:hypothetical protein CEXT_186011 [Caerostris extrusa]
MPRCFIQVIHSVEYGILVKYASLDIGAAEHPERDAGPRNPSSVSEATSVKPKINFKCGNWELKCNKHSREIMNTHGLWIPVLR